MPLTTPPAASAPLYARNKLTGQTYFVGSGVNLIDDLGDVDTVTGPPLDGMVLQWSAAPTGSTGPTGQWVPGPGGAPLSTDADNAIILGTDEGIYSNEVHLGPTGPTLNGPELWADTDSKTIYAAATGPTGAVEWVPVGGVEAEVEISALEPPTNWELWGDITAATPIGATGPIGYIDELSDVDTSTTPPTDGQTLVWDDTISQWVPGAQANSIDDLTDVDTTTVVPADDNVLVWDASVGQWVPKPVVSEVEIASTDPIAANPDAELWYNTGAVGQYVWDANAIYPAGTEVQWPAGTTVNLSNRATQAEEPGAALESGTAYTFPGSTATPAGLSATVSASTFAGGFDAIFTAPAALGANGTLLSIGDSDVVWTRTISGFEVTCKTDGLPAILACQVPDDTNAYWRLTVDPTGSLALAVSSDSFTWPELGRTTFTTTLKVTSSTSLHIGHDNTLGANNYDGGISSVTINALGTTTARAVWSATAQPGHWGLGTSPTTGEFYKLLSNTILIPDTPTPLVSPWDATATVPATAGGLLMARVNGVWTSVTAAEAEVEVADTEPAQLTWDLWVDTSDTSPTDPSVLGMGMNDLTDADTASTPPIVGNVLSWSGTQWMPGVASGVDELNDLFDVDLATTAPVDGDTLVYNEATLTWVPGIGGGRAYRETIPVTVFPATLTVAHGLNVPTVSTTVIAAGPPKTQVTAEVELTDANTVTVTLTTGVVGDYEVLVLG